MSHRWCVAMITCTAGMVLAMSALAGERTPREEARVTQVELRLPADFRGPLPDATEETRLRNEARKVGETLTNRKERGPIHCSMHGEAGKPGANTPELVLTLRNSSEQPVDVHPHHNLADQLTFIVRDADGKIVRAFCLISLSSSMQAGLPVTFAAGETKRCVLRLHNALYHPLAPGSYTIEAVFHEPTFWDLLGPDTGMLSRSGRIAVRVGAP